MDRLLFHEVNWTLSCNVVNIQGKSQNIILFKLLQQKETAFLRFIKRNRILFSVYNAKSKSRTKKKKYQIYHTNYANKLISKIQEGDY